MEATRFDPQTMVIDPPHFKKVIYLDQFAISEMVKAIDTRSKSHARVKQVWRQVFEALERVCKQQLVACPWSPIHRDESLVSEMYEPLRRMYEHLGNGVQIGDLAGGLMPLPRVGSRMGRAGVVGMVRFQCGSPCSHHRRWCGRSCGDDPFLK